MNLTNEQKMEILRKYIGSKEDYVESSTGEILLSVEASKRIAKEFNLTIVENGQFKPMVISDYIIKREHQRLAAQASVKKLKEKKDLERKALEAAIETVVECIKRAKEADKNEFAIAATLSDECKNIGLGIQIKGIEECVKRGILSDSKLIRNNLRFVQNRKAVTIIFASYLEKIRNREQLIESLSDDMLTHYMKGALNFGHMLIALEGAGFDADIIVEVSNMFYQKYEPRFLETYGKAEINDDFIKNIMNKFIESDSFDSNIILGYISKMNKDNLNMDDIAYKLYRLEGDEKSVCQILITPNLSAHEIAEQLRELELQYPVSCLKRTFELLSSAYVLPYDEILKLYEQDPILEEDKEAKLVVEASSKTEDGAMEELAENDLEEDEYTPRRLKIVKKEKEVKKLERKKTLATLLIGAGFIPVAVLSLLFKVDPLVAAGNCVSALSNLSEGAIGLKGILPSAAQLTGLFAGMGTTFVGFAKYLKNRKRLKAAKGELEELTEELEEENIKKGL